MSILPQGLEQSAPHAAQPEGPRATVLLAEDDRALRRYLEVVLRRADSATKAKPASVGRSKTARTNAGEVG